MLVKPPKNYIEDMQTDTASGGYEVPYLEYYFGELCIKLNLSSNWNNKRVLDIGPGIFPSYRYLTEKFPQINLRGIDLCTAALAQTNATNLPVINGDAHELDKYFKANSLDIVYTFHSLEHMFDVPTVLKQIHDVLAPDGILYYSIPMPSINLRKGHWYDIYNEEYMIKLLSRAGLKDMHNETFDPNRIRPEREMIGVACVKE